MDPDLTSKTDAEILNMFVTGLNNGDMLLIDLLLHAKHRNLRFPLDINTAMMIVAAKGKLEILRKILITFNPILNSVDENGRRPIHYAAMNGHLECVRMLVKAGSLVNCAGSDGMMPLHLACIMDHTDVVHLLLKNCALVNSCRSEAGESAVHMTATAGHLNTMTVLLENGGDVNVISAPFDGKQTPLHKAAAGNKHEMVHLLIGYGGNPNIPDGSEMFPLHLAAELGHTESIKVLLEAGALLEATDFNGRTAMHSSVVEGHTDVARLLLLYGANAHVKDGHYRSLLHLAAMRDNAELVELLIEAGLDVNIQDDARLRSPLMLAVYMGSLTAVVKLLELGADVNLADDNQCTPLHLAHCLYGKCSTKSLVHALLEAGARLDLQDLSNQTPLQQFLQVGILRGKLNMECVKLLCEAGSHLATASDNNIHRSPLFRLAYMGNLREALYLALAGWDLNMETWLKLPGKTARQDRLHRMLVDIKTQVPSLLCCCRKIIRTTLSRRKQHREILSSIALLPVPYLIKKFLSLQDLLLPDDSVFNQPDT